MTFSPESSQFRYHLLQEAFPDHHGKGCSLPPLSILMELFIFLIVLTTIWEALLLMWMSLFSTSPCWNLRWKRRGPWWSSSLYFFYRLKEYSSSEEAAVHFGWISKWGTGWFTSNNRAVYNPLQESRLGNPMEKGAGGLQSMKVSSIGHRACTHT